MAENALSGHAWSAFRRIDRFRRGAVGAALRSPLLSWSNRTLKSDQLLIIPQELKTFDPSLIADIRSGYFGLAGATIELDGRSPFAVEPPTELWLEALHGFAWLSDLRADGGDEARQFARRTVLDWIKGYVREEGPAWRADIVARRILSWLANSGFLLDGADKSLYELLLDSLSSQLRLLSISYPKAPDGVPRLVSQIAMMVAGLALADLDDFVEAHLEPFVDELDRQILKDGGHISRNQVVLVDILLELLPLKQCFIARSRQPPERLLAAIRRIIGMIRHMRHGDGSLARFNGVGATMPDRLATALAFDEWLDGPTLGRVIPSGYPRLQRRGLILITDCGSPASGDLAATAQAGALSFELSSGEHAVIVNCGWPGPADAGRRDQARGTAAHSTLALQRFASAKMARQSGRAEGQEIVGLTGPSRVSAEVEERDDGSIALFAEHNGYLERTGLLHRRSLRLMPFGDRLDGVDRLYRPTRVAGTPHQNIRFSIHFHLPPYASATQGSEERTADITLPDGERWRLAAQEVQLGIEESIHFAHHAGPTQSAQIVLHGIALEETEVRWRLYRIDDGRA